MSVRLFLLLLLAQASLPLVVGAAEPPDACHTQGSALIKTIEGANHCRTADDCAVIPYACGIAVNRKELQTVQAAQREFYARCVAPTLRCLHWTKLECELGKCVTR